MQLRFLVLVVVLATAFTSPVQAQETEGPLQDPFLNDLEGAWSMTGHVMGDSVKYKASGTWVLNHQFLRLHMEDVNSPPQYVARVFIGYNPKTETYIAHWLDSSGGRASETLGYAQRGGDMIEFKFDYPDGPFRTTFEKKTEDRWHVHMRSKGDDGQWSTFAEYEMTPRSNP